MIRQIADTSVVIALFIAAILNDDQSFLADKYTTTNYIPSSDMHLDFAEFALICFSIFYTYFTIF